MPQVAESRESAKTGAISARGKPGRFQRLAESERPSLNFRIDGSPVTALQGDSLLVAMLMQSHHLRHSEFDDSSRAGFCLMGACQDCWVWDAEGERIRACSTAVEEGMDIFTAAPEDKWPTLG